MSEHRNAEMIKAKADNMELVVIQDYDDAGWHLSSYESLAQLVHCDFFLCLPQHKEACLHWLNGGEVEDSVDGDWFDIDAHNGNPNWSGNGQLFMDEEYQLRIKIEVEA